MPEKLSAPRSCQKIKAFRSTDVYFVKLLGQKQSLLTYFATKRGGLRIYKKEEKGITAPKVLSS